MITALQQRPANRVHCTTDDWDFDPRYTGGVCPICGWEPEQGEVTLPPAWRQQLARVPWDYVGLGVLLVALVVMGIFVGIAAKINLVPS